MADERKEGPSKAAAIPPGSAGSSSSNSSRSQVRVSLTREDNPPTSSAPSWDTHDDWTELSKGRDVINLLQLWLKQPPPDDKMELEMFLLIRDRILPQYLSRFRVQQDFRRTASVDLRRWVAFTRLIVGNETVTALTIQEDGTLLFASNHQQRTPPVTLSNSVRHVVDHGTSTMTMTCNSVLSQPPSAMLIHPFGKKGFAAKYRLVQSREDGQRYWRLDSEASHAALQDAGRTQVGYQRIIALKSGDLERSDWQVFFEPDSHTQVGVIPIPSIMPVSAMYQDASWTEKPTMLMLNNRVTAVIELLTNVWRLTVDPNAAQNSLFPERVKHLEQKGLQKSRRRLLLLSLQRNMQAWAAAFRLSKTPGHADATLHHPETLADFRLIAVWLWDTYHKHCLCEPSGVKISLAVRVAESHQAHAQRLDVWRAAIRDGVDSAELGTVPAELRKKLHMWLSDTRITRCFADLFKLETWAAAESARRAPAAMGQPIAGAAFAATKLVAPSSTAAAAGASNSTAPVEPVAVNASAAAGLAPAATPGDEAVAKSAAVPAGPNSVATASAATTPGRTPEARIAAFFGRLHSALATSDLLSVEEFRKLEELSDTVGETLQGGLHAEMRLLFHYYVTHGCLPPWIAISTPCCPHCYLVLSAAGLPLLTGGHGVWFPWPLDRQFIQHERLRSWLLGDELAKELDAVLAEKNAYRYRLQHKNSSSSSFTLGQLLSLMITFIMQFQPKPSAKNSLQPPWDSDDE